MVARVVTGMARRRRLTMVVLLDLLLPVLAWQGRCLYACPGRHGRLNLGCVVGLGTPGQIQLIAVRVGHAPIPRLQCRSESPEGCGEDKGRNQDCQNVAHT